MLLNTLFILSSACASRLPVQAGRIVGGDDIPIEQVPWQVSLQYEGRHGCGGSIIAQNFIVTAGHCVYEENIEKLSARAGTPVRESGGQVVNIKKINVHTKFDGLDYDIAVLELASNLTFGPTVAAIGLPSPDQTWPAGTEVLVTGWGLLDILGTYLPLNLQGVTVELIDKETCGLPDTMLCAGVDGGGKDACTDDSGGPLEAEGILIGIVSWGIGCGGPSPGIYANVVTLRYFIQEITGL